MMHDAAAIPKTQLALFSISVPVTAVRAAPGGTERGLPADD
jgi:hypothetical protein